ncbi:lipocalin family protein [Flavobacterium terrisoli]|uniref:lipocalin family protein n=1 Tax=Flavobacterium terrisoli TaxID=3242195 RepID=UPI0025434BBA|nr:lipocalin family protein [Flavobacterium buctense]
MRTIFLLPKLFVLFLLSCSDSDCEDDAATADINKLYGEWILQKSELNGDEVNSHDIAEFTSDTFAKFTHTDEGQNNTDVIDNGAFHIVENTLIINWNNNIDGHSVTKYQILELTETILRWKIVVPHVGTHIETFSR